MNINLNFAMMLPPPVREHATDLCFQVAEMHQACFLLNEYTNYPHITVTTLEIPYFQRQWAHEIIAKVVAESHSLHCVAERVEAHQGFIGVTIRPSREIQRFRQRVVRALVPLQVEQYRVREYNPHLTITRLEDEYEAPAAIKAITWDIEKFTVQSFGLCKVGDHGTCQKPVKPFIAPPLLSKTA